MIQGPLFNVDTSCQHKSDKNNLMIHSNDFGFLPRYDGTRIKWLLLLSVIKLSDGHSSSMYISIRLYLSLSLAWVIWPKRCYPKVVICVSSIKDTGNYFLKEIYFVDMAPEVIKNLKKKCQFFSSLFCTFWSIKQSAPR
jgi:hypothetical protein